MDAGGVSEQGDIEASGFEAGRKVELVSHFEGEERTAHLAVVPHDIPRGCAAIISRG